jgi:ubiquinone/menaquinone biosynthesis C-methylase UbiE
MIELAQSLHVPSARFELMDIEQLAFDDGFFDAAICGHGLQFASDLPRALSEARPACRSAVAERPSGSSCIR